MTGASGGGDVFVSPNRFAVFSHSYIADHIQQFGSPPHMGWVGRVLAILVWGFTAALRVPVLGRALSWLPYYLEQLRETLGSRRLFDFYKFLLVPFFCNTIISSPDLKPSQYDTTLIDPPGLHMLGCHRVLIELKNSGKRCWFVNLHLNHDVSEDGARRRCDEVKRMLRWMHLDGVEIKKDDGMIVVGDWNTLWKQGEPLKKVLEEHGLRSAHAVVHGEEPACTWPSGIVAPFMDVDGVEDWPEGVCLDFIWVSENLQVHDAGLAGDTPSEGDRTLYPSDHIAVWADIS